MALTPNKLLSIQSSTSNAGTWGAGASYSLNEGVISPLDLMLGGILTKTLSNVNVTLSATEIQYSMVRLNGTLTGAVQITSANIGFYMVENVTSGSFAVTVTNGVVGVTIEQSHRYLLFADATNGIRIISNVDLTGLSAQFPAGTVTIFIQAAAPTGWVISSSFNDYGLRLNATGGGGTAGSVPFSTLFARTATDSYTLLTADIPSHTHTGTTAGESNDHTHGLNGTITSGSTSPTHSHQINISLLSTFQGSGGAYTAIIPGSANPFNSQNADATHTHTVNLAGQNTIGVSADHTHSFTSNATGGGGAHAHNLDMRLTYATAIPCTKS